MGSAVRARHNCGQRNNMAVAESPSYIPTPTDSDSDGLMDGQNVAAAANKNGCVGQARAAGTIPKYYFGMVLRSLCHC